MSCDGTGDDAPGKRFIAGTLLAVEQRDDDDVKSSEQRSPAVPVERWYQAIPADAADYLDRPPPTYAEGSASDHDHAEPAELRDRDPAGGEDSESASWPAPHHRDANGGHAIRLQPHVADRDLTPEAIPRLNLRSLDPDWEEGESLSDWAKFWNFALTFNAYRATDLGQDQSVALAENAREHFRDGDDLSDLSLGELRTILFVEQRRWGKSAYWLRCETDHADYLQAILDGIRAEVAERVGALIPTRTIRASQVPTVASGSTSAGLDARAALAEVWIFGRSFDGYRYFGGPPRGLQRLRLFADNVADEYAITGTIPALGEVGMLRACLAAETDRWTSPAEFEGEMTTADVTYIAALLEAIRRRLHGA